MIVIHFLIYCCIFREFFSDCIPAVLEPLMRVEIVSPNEHASSVEGYIGTRSIQIMGSQREVNHVDNLIAICINTIL